MTKLNDCITDYLAFLRHEQGAAPTTCKSYASRLNTFLRWTVNEAGYPTPTLDDFTLPLLRRFLYARSNKGDRPRTIRGWFNALRGLGTFLVNNGALTENPAAKVQLPKMDAATRLLVNDAEVSAMFDACERQRTPRLTALSRAVLSVLCYGAMRRSELCDLHVDDVDLADKSLLIRSGKGRKSRRVFVCADAVDALREWLACRETDCKSDYLFMYDRNRRLHHVGIAALIETLKASAGQRDNDAIKPHGLRHWAATNLLRNGANLRDVQAFLGHSDLLTTSRYLHSSEEQLRSIAELTALRPPQSKQKPATNQQEARQKRPRRIAR